MSVAFEHLCELYRQACEVDVQAFKPGNVSIYAEGHAMSVADFMLSAQVSSAPLCNLEYSLGEKIYYSVQATREAVGCNTNLGIILLCAPLIHAIANKPPGWSLRQSLSRVLASTTIADADWVFKAITLASPGGLGRSDHQDVSEQASVTLLEAMKIASAKDRIALQYLTDYEDIFNFSVIRYNAASSRFGDRFWAATSVYADMLSQFPDSHIERKYGDQYTEIVATKMARLSDELSKTDNPEQIKPLLFCLDQELKSYGINPGTTADMIVATVLAIFLEGLS
jgi:triphosphoribosyl-dephospho-CoA synthase